MEDPEDLTFINLENCTYRHLQQIAKSKGLPSNVKKVYLIELIHAKEYSSEEDLEAIIDRIKEERKLLAHTRKPAKRRKKWAQGVEISSTSNQSPSISTTPKRSSGFTIPSRESIMKYHTPNMLRPTSKRSIESDRVLRSSSNRMRPNYSILNVSDAVINVERLHYQQRRQYQQEGQYQQERQYQLSMAFEQCRPMNIRDCMLPAQRQLDLTDCAVQTERQFDSERMDVEDSVLVPVTRSSNLNLQIPLKPQRRLSGIYPLKPSDRALYQYLPSVGLRQQDGRISKINALVQKPIGRNLPRNNTPGPSTEKTARPILTIERQNIVPKLRTFVKFQDVKRRPHTVTLQKVINYKIDQNDFTNSSTESARDSSTERERENILKENMNRNTESRSYATEEVVGYTESRIHATENANECTESNDYTAKNLNICTENRGYVTENPNIYTENRGYVTENPNRYSETRDYTTETPNRYTENRDCVKEIPNKYTENRAYVIEHPNRYAENRDYATEHPNRYIEYRDYATETPNRYTENRDYVTEIPNNYTEYRDYATETPNTYTENRDYVTENPNNYTESGIYTAEDDNGHSESRTYVAENIKSVAIIQKTETINVETETINVETDYPNMSGLTDICPENQVAEISTSSLMSTFTVYYHKKIRAEQVRSHRPFMRQPIQTEGSLPRITDVFSQIKDVRFKDLTQPLCVQVSGEPGGTPNPVNNTLLEKFYNIKIDMIPNRKLDFLSQPLDPVPTTAGTRCVYSTSIMTTAIAHAPTAVSNEYNAHSYERANQPQNVDTESMPRLFDYIKMIEQELKDVKCDEVLSASSSLGTTNSQELGANVTIPELVEDAYELISQDGDYLERIGMDVRMQCVLCDWAGPKIILEYHIRQEHSSEIEQQEAAEWSSIFSLGALAASELWCTKVFQYSGNLFLLSAKYMDVDCFMALLTILPTESEELPKRSRLTIYNKVTGEPHNWEGDITVLSDSMPYHTDSDCLKLDITKLDLLPNSANLKLINGELVVNSTTKVVIGQPELDSIEIAISVKVF